MKYTMGAALIPLLPRLSILDPAVTSPIVPAYTVISHACDDEFTGFVRIQAATPSICQRTYELFWNPQQRWKWAESKRRFALTPDGRRAQQMLIDLMKESEIGSVEEFRFVESLV